uniref:Uncharacterized protein n=1 Tax=Romanomermis culicivorax TaxID=13658 RepID=A0A915JND4_ROMCU
MQNYGIPPGSVATLSSHILSISFNLLQLRFIENFFQFLTILVFEAPRPKELLDRSSMTLPRYIQLAYPDGRALIFKALLAMEEDWTAFFKHLDNTHTIVSTFANNDWHTLYTLLGPSFHMHLTTQNAHTMNLLTVSLPLPALLTSPCSLEEYKEVEMIIGDSISKMDNSLRMFFMIQCWLDVNSKSKDILTPYKATLPQIQLKFGRESVTHITN